MRASRCLQCLNCHAIFFFNEAALSDTYTLSLHDALPIYRGADPARDLAGDSPQRRQRGREKLADRHGAQRVLQDRKSTRLNSSHVAISYAVFCLKKKKSTLRRTRDDRELD